ncbi:MAG: hypothetical protein OQK48_03355 [Sulfurimonas sp.]|uniref:hypothetical protein n=1 Tax=Sulfurimonas sp. TaxID=2022749 RepID=UPI00260F1686|nr:hypothetical protein [Sulfurimonas sp.]MCW8894301.1 hypothetical protein [Sulfurimonas sp.]MCW8953958.1 hypothetical protein [Sulfurimonas sp.]MCW9068009.1 hypothetical protein [Sulfurimonas sp.]
MNKKSRFVFYSFITLGALLLLELSYIQSTKSVSSEVLNYKRFFVEQIGLPDLAISTEANYVRHRSLSDMFGIYKDDASLREYFVSTFTYSHSNTINEKRLNER